MISSGFFIFILKSSIGLSLSWIYYLLFLKNRGSIYGNRLFLVLTPLISILLALLHHPVQTPTPSAGLAPSQLQVPSPNLVPESLWTGTAELISYPVTIQGTTLQLGTLVGMAYWIVVSILLLGLVITILRVVRMIRRAQVIDPQLHLLYSVKYPIVGSFFHWIFWHQPQFSEEDQAILEHERTHVRQGHTYDLLWMEVLRSFYWYMPFLAWWKKHLILHHEFLADQQALTKTDKKSYGRLLLQYNSARCKSPIHSFSGYLKTRIRRLVEVREVSQRRLWIWMLPVFIVLGWGFTTPFFKSLENRLDELGNQALLINHSHHTAQKDMFYVRWDNHQWIAHDQVQDFKTYQKLRLYCDVTLSIEEVQALYDHPVEFLFGDRILSIRDTSVGAWEFADNDIDNPDRFTTVRWRSTTWPAEKRHIPKQLYKRIQNANHGDNVRLSLSSESLNLLLSINIHNPERMTEYLKWGRQMCSIENVKKSYKLQINQVDFELLSEKPELWIMQDEKIPITDQHFLLIKDSSYTEEKTLNGIDLTDYEAIVCFLQNNQGHCYASFLKNKKFANNHTVIVQDNFKALLDHRIFENGEPISVLNKLPVRFQFSEKPIRLEWVDYEEKDLLRNLTVYGGKVSKKGFKSMLQRTPVLYRGDQSIPGKMLFMDVTHIKRHDLPIKFSLAYDLESGRLADGTTSIREILRRAKVGDSFRFENIRTHFSNRDGFGTAIMIEPEEIIERIKAEKRRHIPYLQGKEKNEALLKIVETL